MWESARRISHQVWYTSGFTGPRVAALVPYRAARTHVAPDNDNTDAVMHLILHLLLYLTNFGDPYLTVPLATLVLAWFAAQRFWRPLITWACCFSAGALLVAASRIAHAGWGMAMPALDFTVISGHTMLSSAVYPTLLALFASRNSPRTVMGLFGLGFAFAIAIGASRVLIGFHSTSEVVSGLAIGTLVSLATCAPIMMRQAREATGNVTTMRDPTPFTAFALALVVICHGKVAPVSIWIDHKAPQLSQWSRTQFDDAR